MSRFLIMGLFALTIVGVTLWRILADRDLVRLQRIKRLWGRTLGLGIHFAANVGLPLVVGIVFVSMGAAGLDSQRPDLSPFTPLTTLCRKVAAEEAALNRRVHLPVIVSFSAEDMLMP